MDRKAQSESATVSSRRLEERKRFDRRFNSRHGRASGTSSPSTTAGKDEVLEALRHGIHRWPAARRVPKRPALDLPTTLIVLQICSAVALRPSPRSDPPRPQTVEHDCGSNRYDSHPRFRAGQVDSGNVCPPASSNMTHVGYAQGTWYYASLESVARDPDLADVRTDVYALVVLFGDGHGLLPLSGGGESSETVARHIGRRRRRPSSLRAEVDDELDTIIPRRLRKDPQTRYQSVAASRTTHPAPGRRADPRQPRQPRVICSTQRHGRYRWYPAGAGVGLAAVIGLAFMYAILYWRAAAAYRPPPSVSSMVAGCRPSWRAR